MSKKFTDLKKNWEIFGYNRLLSLPIKTNINLSGSDRHIITHRGVSFVWVNGDENSFPSLIIPFKRDFSKSSLLSGDYSAFDVALEYISLIAFEYKYFDIDINHKSFKNYFSDDLDSVETLQLGYRRSLDVCISVEESDFTNIKNLSEKENTLLALFRDGNSQENFFHSYLSFFRICENVFPPQQKKIPIKYKWKSLSNWINENLENIKREVIETSPMGDYDSFMDNVSKYKDINPDRELIDYLVDQCRNAVSHGSLGEKNIKSPERFRDYLEMYYANKFIKSAAFLIIKDTLKI